MTTYPLTPEKILTNEIPPIGTYDPPPEYLPKPCPAEGENGQSKGKTNPDSSSAQICAECSSS